MLHECSGEARVRNECSRQHCFGQHASAPLDWSTYIPHYVVTCLLDYSSGTKTAIGLPQSTKNCPLFKKLLAGLPVVEGQEEAGGRCHHRCQAHKTAGALTPSTQLLPS